MTDKYYVIVRDYEAFLRWCRIYDYDKHRPNIYCVERPTALYGVSAPRSAFVFDEFWWQNPDAHEINEQINIAIASYEAKSVKVVNKVNGIFTKTFWKRTAERVVSTFAQTLLGMGITTTMVNIDFKYVLTGAGIAALASLLKALAGSYMGTNSADPGWVSTTEKDKDTDDQATRETVNQ